MVQSTNSTFTAISQNSAEVKAPNAELMTLSISGTFTGTIALQRSFDAGATWITVESYTVASEKNIEQASKDFIWRLATTAWSSGTATYYLGGERII